jgi:hypothetical protein
VARRRTGWSRLTKASRDRLVAAGRTGKLNGDSLTPDQVRAYWEGGGDLSTGYGHPRKVPGRAPVEATQRASRGLDTADDKAALDKWRRSRRAPSWIPKSRAVMGDETAAALSAIDLDPKRWESVTFTYSAADGRFLMTVSPKGRGPDRYAYLPNHEAVGDVARLIREPSLAGTTPAQRKRLESQWSKVRIGVNVQGTDQASVAKAKRSRKKTSRRPSTPSAVRSPKSSPASPARRRPSPKPKPAQPKAPRKTSPKPGSRKRKR